MNKEYMQKKRAEDAAFKERQLAMNRTARAAERELARRHRPELEKIKYQIRVAEGLINDGIPVGDLL